MRELEYETIYGATSKVDKVYLVAFKDNQPQVFLEQEDAHAEYLRMYIHDPHMVVEYEAQLLVPEGVSVYSKRRVRPPLKAWVREVLSEVYAGAVLESGPLALIRTWAVTKGVKS